MGTTYVGSHSEFGRFVAEEAVLVGLLVQDSSLPLAAVWAVEGLACSVVLDYQGLYARTTLSSS